MSKEDPQTVGVLFSRAMTAPSSPKPTSAFRGIFRRIPFCTGDNIRAVLSVADYSKAACADPKDFYDNRFIKELEGSGFIQELYGRR